MDSGGQHSAVEASFGSGATSDAHLRSLALRLSVAHLLAGTGWLGVTLLIAGLVRSLTFVRVPQVPEAWGLTQMPSPLLFLSRPRQLSLRGIQQELLNAQQPTRDPSLRSCLLSAASSCPPPLSPRLNGIDFAKQRGRCMEYRVTRKLASLKQTAAPLNRMQILEIVQEALGDKNDSSGFHVQSETRSTHSSLILSVGSF